MALRLKSQLKSPVLEFGTFSAWTLWDLHWDLGLTITVGVLARMTHQQCDRGQGDCDGDDDCFDVTETLDHFIHIHFHRHLSFQGLRVN